MSGTDERADIHVEADGGVLRVTFDRPEQRNAMTFAMYAGLVEACERADADEAIRVVVLRGAGGQAFVAGTDIRQFAGFDGEQGVAYEGRIDATIGRLLEVTVPVVAAIDGFCIGGGLAIASAADLRIASTDARFGYPIARTLGNTLSARSHALAVRHFGHARTIDMIATARLFDADEALTAGFLSRVTDDVTATTDEVVGRILAHAPLTIASSKEQLRRLYAVTGDVDDADLLRRVYGSEDFAAGVAAFTAPTTPGTRRGAPVWRGR